MTTDIITSARVSYLDAAKPFPYADETFDYVFSEHMIEHIPWKDGLQMLRECKRVLKGKGIVRIATPDLAVLVKVYREEGGEPAKKYVKWITDRYLTDIST